MTSRTITILFAVSALSAFSQEPVDLSVIHRIKAEALENSKVMEHVFYLTDANGPRLTNSPGFKSAGDWVVKRLQEYGLTNVHEETWGPFGRGWSYTHFAGHMIEPAYAPLIGFPLAWSPGTQGVVQGEAIYAPLETDADFDKFKGKLRGKIVLTMKMRDLVMPTEPAGSPSHRGRTHRRHRTRPAAESFPPASDPSKRRSSRNALSSATSQTNF